jgi:hypothetical protein
MYKHLSLHENVQINKFVQICASEEKPGSASVLVLAAALTLSGNSVMAMASNSPKAKNEVWMRPPRFSIGFRITSMRSCGLAIRRAKPQWYS